MKISEKEIRALLKALKFKTSNSQDNILSKDYNDEVSIQVDFSKEKILYDKTIKKGDETTSNFENSENFVVLECVDRLLEKGYSAKKISLEQKWSVGKGYKGKLDILVNDKEDKSYLMIECKDLGRRV